MTRANEGLVAVDDVTGLHLLASVVGAMWDGTTRCMRCPSAFMGSLPTFLSCPFPTSVRSWTRKSEPRCWLSGWQELEDLEAGVQLAHSWVRRGSRCSPGLGQLARLHVPCPEPDYQVQSQRASHVTGSDSGKRLVQSGQQENWERSGAPQLTHQACQHRLRLVSPWPYPPGVERKMDSFP